MNLRRAVIRLLLLTAFLLFIAWVGLKMLSYRGDLEAMLRDSEKWLGPVKEFFQKSVLPLWEKVVEFVREKLQGAN